MTRLSSWTNIVAASAPVTAAPGYSVRLYNANGLILADLGSSSNEDCQVTELVITEKLTELDDATCKIPRKLLTNAGTPFYKHTHAVIEGILEVIREADGHTYRFRIKDRYDDKEQFVELTCKEAGVDLVDIYTNESSGGSYFYGRKPSEIMNTILAGKRHIRIKNPRFGILDASGLPTNWTHPTGWSAGRGTDGYPYYAAPASPAETFSSGDKIACTPLATYQVQFKARGTSTMTGAQVVELRFLDVNNNFLSSSQTYRLYEGIASDANERTVTGNCVAPANAYYIQPELSVLMTDKACYYSDVQMLETMEDSNWRYFAISATDGSNVDIRDTDIYANNSHLIYKNGVKWDGTIPSGYWDGTSYNWDSPSGSYVSSTAIGSKLTGIFVSPYVTCHFDGSGVAGSIAKISILNPGTDNTSSVTSISVSADTNYTINTDPNRESGIEIELVSGTVRFVSFELSPENLLSLKFDEATALDAVASIQEAIGGEVDFDGAISAIHHYTRKGTDWTTTTGCPIFMRGSNLPKLTLKQESTNIVNRLLFEGYGGGTEDAPKLLIVVDADERDSSGSASRDYYGVRKGKYSDKSVRSYSQGYQMAKKIANKNCWPIATYETEIFDAAVRDGTLLVGDTIRCIYNEADVSLRIQEIRRDIFEPKKGELIVGDPLTKAGEVIARIEKQLKGIATPQGFLIPQTYGPVIEDFDTTYSATLEFDVMYGQDFEHLYLTFDLTGLRSTTKSAQNSSAVGGTSNSGGYVSTSTESSSINTTDNQGGGNTTGPSSSYTGDGGEHNHIVATRTSGAYVPTNYEYNRWLAYDTNYNSFSFQTHGGDALGVGWQWGTTTIGVHSHSMQSHYHTIGSHYHNMSHWHSFSVPNHTHTFSLPAHTHTLSFGIYESPNVPTKATVELGFGGTYNVITEACNGTSIRNLDIKKYLKRDSTGLPYEGTHTLRFRAPVSSDTGRIKARLFGVSYIVTRLD